MIHGVIDRVFTYFAYEEKARFFGSGDSGNDVFKYESFNRVEG